MYKGWQLWSRERLVDIGDAIKVIVDPRACSRALIYSCVCVWVR